MKTWICIMTALLLMLGCALAQEIPESDITTPRLGFAVAAPQDAETGGTVPMYEKPDINSRVLMSYYSGAQMEALSILGDMVRVQCGVEGASVMGYMRTEDLRYGALAMREVPRCYMRYTIWHDDRVYAYCDDQANVIRTADGGVQIRVYGENDAGWGQLLLDPILQTGDWEYYTPERGFMRVDKSVNSEFIVQEGEWFVLPLSNEMTFEEAKARAIELVLETPEIRAKLSDRYRSREALETQFWSDVRLHYDEGTDTTFWQVFLQAGEDHSQNFTIYMDADGELEEINKGNG